MQPPQGPWGQAPPPFQPPGTPGGYPAPGGFAPAPYGSAAATVSKLNDELQSWLIITAVLWFTGLFVFAGPLAWWKAGDLRQKYEALGVPPHSNVGMLRLVGILTCVLAAIIVLVIGVLVVGGIMFALSSSGPR